MVQKLPHPLQEQYENICTVHKCMIVTLLSNSFLAQCPPTHCLWPLNSHVVYCGWCCCYCCEFYFCIHFLTHVLLLFCSKNVEQRNSIVLLMGYYPGQRQHWMIHSSPAACMNNAGTVWPWKGSHSRFPVSQNNNRICLSKLSAFTNRHCWAMYLYLVPFFSFREDWILSDLLNVINH